MPPLWGYKYFTPSGFSILLQAHEAFSGISLDPLLTDKLYTHKTANPQLTTHKLATGNRQRATAHSFYYLYRN